MSHKPLIPHFAGRKNEQMKRISDGANSTTTPAEVKILRMISSCMKSSATQEKNITSINIITVATHAAGQRNPVVHPTAASQVTRAAGSTSAALPDLLSMAQHSPTAAPTIAGAAAIKSHTPPASQKNIPPSSAISRTKPIIRNLNIFYSSINPSS